jgi:hypothetical protein
MRAARRQVHGRATDAQATPQHPVGSGAAVNGLSLHSSRNCCTCKTAAQRGTAERQSFWKSQNLSTHSNAAAGVVESSSMS